MREPHGADRRLLELQRSCPGPQLELLQFLELVVVQLELLFQLELFVQQVQQQLEFQLELRVIEVAASPVTARTPRSGKQQLVPAGDEVVAFAVPNELP